MTFQLHKLIPAALALCCAVALGVAGVAQAASSKSHHRHHSHHVKHHSAIPQHNGGDRDADNNGGPSDGDGGI